MFLRAEQENIQEFPSLNFNQHLIASNFIIAVFAPVISSCSITPLLFVLLNFMGESWVVNHLPSTSTQTKSHQPLKSSDLGEIITFLQLLAHKGVLHCLTFDFSAMDDLTMGISSE